MQEKQIIYFDSAATTKPGPAAIEAFTQSILEYGNPSSTHFLGMAARRIIEKSRFSLANAFGCSADEIIFTGCGSESNNQAIIGVATTKKRFSDVIVTTDSEHPSVEEPMRFLENAGFKVIRLSTKDGTINEEELKVALSQKVSLVSVMRANNETGALYDIAMIRKNIDSSGCGAVFHCDAVQGFLKTADRTDLYRYCDMASVSAHKINAFKGCGAFFVKKGVKVPAFLLGGGQEKGLRSGTENTPSIAAFGAAVEDWVKNRNRIDEIKLLRDYTQDLLKSVLKEKVKIHMPPDRLCSILSIELTGVKSEVALNYLSSKGICISAGSACSSKKKDNRTLTSFGLSRDGIHSTLRISFGYENTKEEADLLVNALCETSDLYGQK